MKLITGVILAVVAVVAIDATAMTDAREKCGKNIADADKDILTFKELPKTPEQRMIVVCIFKEVGFMDSNKHLVREKAPLLFDELYQRNHMLPLINPCTNTTGETEEEIVKKFFECMFKN